MNTKVLCISIALILINSLSGNAQILPKIDFENSNIDSISVDQGETAVTFSCVDNPENAKLNKSSKVLKIEISGDDVTDKGPILSFSKIQPSTNFYLHLKVYTPGTQFTVSAISMTSSRIYGDESYNVAYQNQWVEMVFPLNKVVYIQGIKFLPKTAGTIYIDDITINSDPNISCASIKDSEAMTVDVRSAITVGEDTIISHTAAMNRDYTLEGNGELHFTYPTSPLVKSTVNLNSEDAWLFFDSIRPLTVFGLLSKITVNGSRATINNNVRVEMYGEGTVVIPQGTSFAALTVYNDINRKGESKELVPETYYSSTLLGAFDNEISSFVLKKGYMATFAESSNGTGSSRVYIATDKDIVVNKMPIELDKSVSFVRVFPWRYTTKKGYCSGSDDNHEKLKVSWFYTWGPSSSSRSLNKDFTAMVTGKSDWFPYGTVNSQTGLNHVLGYNEPDQTEQANMPMQEMINGWPSMMASGLRVGSPAYASIGNGLYTFMRECEHRNYRVDFVALHAYFGGWERSNWTNYFSTAYNNTHRPLWTTEWNNGANWTTEGGNKTEAEQKKDITYILDAMESTDYFERYSIYNWVEDWRRVIRDGDGSLTPAGEVYRDTKSKISFNKTYEYIQNPIIEKDQTFLIRNQRDGYLYQDGTSLKTSGSTATTNLSNNYYWTVEYMNGINNKTGHYRIKNVGTGEYIAYSGNANSAGGYTIQTTLSKNNNLSLAHYQTIGTSSNAPFSYYTVSFYNTTNAGTVYTYDYQSMDSYPDKVVGSYSDLRSTNQLWAFVPQETFDTADSLVFRISSKLEMRKLVAEQTSLNTTKSESLDAAQYWVAKAATAGTYTLTNLNNGMNLAITAAGPVLRDADVNDGEQRITLAYVYRDNGTSYYTLRNGNTGLILNGSELSTATSTKKDPNLWALTPYDKTDILTETSIVIREANSSLKNFPNPVTTTTTISYSLPYAGDKATLSIYDNQGRLISSRTISADEGFNQHFWSKGILEPGIYLYEVRAERSGAVYFRAVSRMIIQ